MQMAQDTALVKKSLSGERGAFAELIHRYRNAVYGLLLNRIGDFDQAEDLAQEAFVEAYVHLSTLKRHARFGNWLCGIASNLCNRWLEGRKREWEVMEQMAQPEEGAGSIVRFRGATEPGTPEQDYAARQLKEAVWQAVAGLPDRSREAILLFYFGDMSHRQIAGFLGVAPNTVLSHLRHGRQKLRDRLTPLFEETIRDKALGRRFTEKVLASLPLIAFPKPRPTFPPARWGLSLKGAAVGVGVLALAGGLAGWIATFGGASQPPMDAPPESRRLRVRLATPQEMARLAEKRRQEEETQMSASEQATVIEGVPDMEVGGGWDALLRGLEILLKHRGESATLNELMAYSGDAFNLCYGSHWQGATYLCIPTDPASNVARTYGYESRWLLSGYGHEMQGLDKEARHQVTEKVLDQLWAEIDAGRPVLVGGCNDGGCGDWSVVAGYDRQSLMMSHIGIGKAYRWIGIRGVSLADFDLDPDNGKPGYWNGRPRGTVRPNFVGAWQNNPAFILGKKTGEPTQKERVLSTLRRAVEIFRAQEHNISWWGGVTYYFGEKAYEQWANALHELDYPADLEKPQPDGAYDWYADGTMDILVDCIVRGRTAAAQFCEKAADSVPKVHQQLSIAAQRYREEVQIAQNSFGAFMPAFSGVDGPRVAWLSDEGQREAGVAAIEQMLKEERAAIAEIEKALSTPY